MLIFLAFAIQSMILLNTRGKNEWFRFVPFITVEIYPLYKLWWNKTMYAQFGTAFAESAVPWYGLAILAGYVLAWCVYAVKSRKSVEE